MQKKRQKLKYPKEAYINCEYFGGDEEMKFRKVELVKCRKPHECVGIKCDDIRIKPGDYAVKETALFYDVGWKSCYICVRCIEKWLDEIKVWEPCKN